MSSPNLTGRQTTSSKSYAQVVGVATNATNDYTNFGFPLYLHTQLSSSSGGTNTPISSCSSCHELNNILDAEGVSALSSNELKRKLTRVQHFLRNKRIQLNHFQTRFTEAKDALEKADDPDFKFNTVKTQLNLYYEKARSSIDSKKKAECDLNDLKHNKIYEWQTKHPDCKTAMKPDHMNSKITKLQQEIDSLKDKIGSFENDMKYIGGGKAGKDRRSLANQDSRVVGNIRASKEKLSTTIKKRNELKSFMEKVIELQEKIKQDDNEYKELQAKIKSMKEESDPLRNAIELRDKVQRFTMDIGMLEIEEKLLQERRVHIAEQRRISKLSIENESTPVRTGDGPGSSSLVGLNRPQSSHKYRHNLDIAAQLLAELKSVRDLKRNQLHQEVLRILVYFALDDVFLRDGPEPCIEFLEKYLKNSPPRGWPSKGDFSPHKTSGISKLATENYSQNGESGYRSLSTGDRALYGISDEIIEALSTSQSQNTFSVAPLTDMDSSSVGILDSSSQAPQVSQTGEPDEDLADEVEEPLARTFSEQMFSSQESSAATLQQITKESEKTPYISDWMASKSVSNSGVATSEGSEKNEAPNTDPSTDSFRSLSLTSNTDFQNLEEYPPLKPLDEDAP